MSKIKKVFYNYVRITVLHIVVLVLGIVSVVILARSLGPYDYGRYNLFVFASQLLSLLAWNWCLNPAAAKFASEEFLTDRVVSKTFTAELVLIFGCTAVVGALCVLLRRAVSGFLGFGDNVVVILVFLHLMAMSVFNLVYFCFQGSMNFRFYGKMPVWRSILFVVPLALLYFNKTFGVQFVMIALVLSYLIATIIVWPRLMRICSLVFDRRVLSGIVSFSWVMIIFASANFALDWVDKFWIRKMVSVYAVGIYSAAWVLTTNLVIIPQQLYTIVMPLVTAYKLENRSGNILFYLNKLVPQMSFVFSALAALLILLSGIFLPLMYGAQYGDSVNVFVILVVSSLFMGVKYFYNPVSTVFNYIKSTGTVNVASAVLCVGLNYAFIGRFGIMGAAAATALSSLVACVAVAHVINRQFGIVNFRAVYCSAPSVLIAVFYLLTRNLPAGLAFAAAVFWVTYVLMRKFRVFSADDLVYLEKIDMPVWLKKGTAAFYRGFK